MSHRSPLHGHHERLGARFTDFGGWEMPLQYQGTLAEHQSVRTGCGVFDVSHLGRFSLQGSDAVAITNRLLCNDLARIGPGRAQYTMMLTDEGGVVDDIIVWWLADDHLLILPNGVNHDIVRDAFAAAEGDATVIDLRPTTALLAVQGPDAPEVLGNVLGGSPRRFRTLETDQALAAGTGYTGEAGGELVIDLDHAEAVWDDLLAAGAVPCGLGARDTLRLEMGYPLWGQDLDRDTNPLEAGLGWVVGWQHDFIGRTALERVQASGPDRVLIGFAFDERRVPRHGYALRCGDSSGVVTSGNFSPSLGVGIGMGFVAPVPAPNDPIFVGIRGDWIPARRVDPPFLER